MEVKTDKKAVDSLLSRGVEEVLVRENLRKRLMSGERLRIKWGIDPTGSMMHLGHAVILRKLKEFQDRGHKIIFLIGDFTARIGDPTGRSKERRPMTEEEIRENMQGYKAQAGLMLDMKKVEVRHNSEWLSKMDFRDLIVLTSKVTYAQVSQRADFKDRIRNDQDLSLQEMLYPVMQGYDSVALKADVEIGGTDQKFNLLMGRQLQKRYGQSEQDIVTCPILEGLHGKDKMSKSLDNYVALLDPANEMYGKIMSLADGLIARYFTLCTSAKERKIKEIEEALKAGKNPRDLKAELALDIVGQYHGKEAAERAEAEFNKVFKDKGKPRDIPDLHIEKKKYPPLDLLFDLEIITSKSQAKRVIEQGGFRVNEKKITDWKTPLKLNDGDLLQIGKRKFVRIRL